MNYAHKPSKMTNICIFVIFLAMQEVLSKVDGQPSTDEDKIIYDRVSSKKCDEYYEKTVELLDVPVSATKQLNHNSITTLLPSIVARGVSKRDTTSSYEFPMSDAIPPIVGGLPTWVGEFPHMVGIGWCTGEKDCIFNCGGALISSRYVLTAAHCTYAVGEDQPYPSVVRLGDQNIDSSVNDGANTIDISIKSIVKHPEYRRKKHYNDIALLELLVDVNFTRNILPACLWINPDNGNYTKAIATGWGVINPETGEKANELQKVTLSLLTNEYCNVSLSDIINKKWDRGFHNSQLCAGEPQGGKDTCQGDSGSPLQVVTKIYPPKYYVMGITSFGPRVCARLPAIYTRVFSYLDWIESIVWPEDYKLLYEIK